MTLGRILGTASLPLGVLAAGMGWYLADQRADQRPDQAAGGWAVIAVGVLVGLVAAGMLVTGWPRVQDSPGGRRTTAGSAAGTGATAAGLPDARGTSGSGGAGLLALLG
ncbi:hypothetical protein [Geodermatophilus sp. SYSU D00710]